MVVRGVSVFKHWRVPSGNGRPCTFEASPHQPQPIGELLDRCGSAFRARVACHSSWDSIVWTRDNLWVRLPFRSERLASLGAIAEELLGIQSAVA